MEQAPARANSEPARGPQLLTLSARTPAALVQAASRLGAHLAAAPDCNLADVAWTLASGRKAFAHRLALVAGDAADAATQLRGDELRSEEHTSELQSLMRISYAVFCLKKNTNIKNRAKRNLNKHNQT